MRKIKPKLASAERLNNLITHYFEWIKGEYRTEPKEINGVLTDEKVWVRLPEPPTIAGLALHLGFSSLKEMSQYESTGKYPELIQGGRLRVIYEYEKRLLNGPASGAIFALKGILDWNGQDEDKPSEPTNINLKTEIITAGPPLASSERDVVL
ncbi:MAG: hypothetical protein JST50_01060 [Bacteroidetes bacterium]|jgi:hypothetical protein|nr:hypothetical protein [Bacteroidota bacterium]